MRTNPKFRLLVWQDGAVRSSAPLFCTDQKTARSRGTDAWSFYEGRREVTVTNMDTGKIIYRRLAKAAK